MLFYTPLLALASLVVVNASPLSLSERATCSSYTIVSTRGTGEPQGPSTGYRSMISQLKAAVPGGTEYDTVYPAGANQQSSAGTADIIKKVQSGNTPCYVLLGYSQGAAATVNALKQLSGAAADSVKAVVMIGDPQHKSGLACNTDADGGSRTKNSNGISAYGLNFGVPSSFVSKTLDICAYGDGVCDTSSGYGITAAHLSYGGNAKTQSMGAQFLQKGLTA